MLEPGDPSRLGFGVFSVFAVLAGLALLVGADHASPGCTGPEVRQCDYVATARSAVERDSHRRFQSDLGFEIADQGSSVRVQQFLPDSSAALFEGPAVLIDKKSCRPCAIERRVAIEDDAGTRVSRIPPQTLGVPW